VKLPIAAGMIAVALTQAACSAPPRAAVADPPPVTVALGRVEVADLAAAFEAGGVVRARTTASIASRVMAPITDIRVRAGDRVRRHAVLVTLDARDDEANRARADAMSLAAAASARAAEADVRAAESDVTLARATHERIAGLQAKRSATAQELDQAVAALSAADAQRTSALARLAAAHAARDAAHASASAASIAASYTILSAPFDSVVTERRADPGSMAMPGAALLVVEDPSAYRLEVSLDEARAALLRTGDPADVRFDAPVANIETWTQGRLAEIARVDLAAHTFLLKIDLPVTPDLRSGLFGRARFRGPARRTLTAPASAIVTRGQLTFVYLVDDSARTRLRAIAIGARDGDRVEVLAGLHEGDRVVISPAPSLTDGRRVTGARP
jgi:RND family efflux transporter MFP subunit